MTVNNNRYRALVNAGIPDPAARVLADVDAGVTQLTGSKTWDPPSVNAAAQTSTTVTVTGAVLGDLVIVSFSLDLQLMQLTGYVSAADTVTALLRNGTAGAIDLASGTLSAIVLRAGSVPSVIL